MLHSARTYLFALILGFSALSAPDALSAAKGAEVRVPIMNSMDLDVISVTAHNGSVQIISRGSSFSVRAGQSIRIARRGSEVQVKVGRRTITSSFVKIEGAPGGSFTIEVPTSSEIRTYSGSLEIRTDRSNSELQIVNLVPLEDYVASVVGSEYGLDDLQGAKAMAIAARTYALHALQHGRNLLDDERSQVYKGLSHATAASRRAALETAGQVLKYRGNLIEAVYSASNGGRSATNESIWGSKPLPYLRSRKDPFDSKASPYASWSWTVDESKLLKALSRAYGFTVKNVKISSSKKGRVEEVRLDGKSTSRQISGSSFRATVAGAFGSQTLRSTYFSVKKRRGSYSFDGHGFGHGVGLSQWGAHGMALAGRSFSQILDFYYSGTKLERIASSDADLSAVEVAVLSGPSQTRFSEPAISNAGSRSLTGKSASLQRVSNKSATPKEKISTFSATKSGRAISAKNVWGSSKKGDTDPKVETKRTTKKRTSRSGW